jgi:hypothetical protein
VAQVTVVSATVVPQEDAADGKPCGIVYRAKVVQALKGSRTVMCGFSCQWRFILSKRVSSTWYSGTSKRAPAQDLFASLNVALPYEESKRLKCKFPAGYYVSLAGGRPGI